MFSKQSLTVQYRARHCDITTLHAPCYFLQIEVEDLTGIRIGIVKEGFGLEKSEEAVDRIVRESAQQLTSVGAKVEDVSIPLHSLCKLKSINGVIVQAVPIKILTPFGSKFL